MARYQAKYLTPGTPRRSIPMRYILLVVSLLTLLSTSALLAKYVTNGGEKQNTLNQVQVSCKANEVVDKGSNAKTSITVTNTSTVDVYIRVRLVSYWQTPSGNIAGRTAAVPAFTLGADWIPGGEDTYYYKTRLPAGNATTNLLGTSLILADPSDENVDGYIQVVKILAEAIQADGTTENGTPAVTDAWGVVLDANGNITHTTP